MVVPCFSETKQYAIVNRKIMLEIILQQQEYNAISTLVQQLLQHVRKQTQGGGTGISLNCASRIFCRWNAAPANFMNHQYQFCIHRVLVLVLEVLWYHTLDLTYIQQKSNKVTPFQNTAAAYSQMLASTHQNSIHQHSCLWTSQDED